MKKDFLNKTAQNAPPPPAKNPDDISDLLNPAKKDTNQDVPQEVLGPSAKPTPQAGDSADKKQKAAPSKQYHSFSNSVEKLQEKMFQLANHINIQIPQLIPGGDTFNKDLAEKYKIDTSLFQKIKDVSKKLSKDGQQAPDGLWGPKTQEGLNAIYSYLELLVNSFKPNDNGWKSFLENFAITASPGKKFTDIPSNEVDPNADSLIQKLDKINELTTEFAEYIKTGKPLPADQKKEDGKPVAPTKPEVGVAGSESPASPVATTQQQKEQKTVAASLVFPFELETDIISFKRFEDFVGGVRALLVGDKDFYTSMGTSVNLLDSNIREVNRLLTGWRSVATPASIEGGFSLSVNENITQFTQTYANNDFKKARDMLNILSSICLGLSNTVRALSVNSIDGVKSPGGGEIYREQYQRGLTYGGRITDMLAQINRAIGYNG